MEDHQKIGFKVCPGSGGTYWIRHGPFSMVRFPTYCTDAPLKSEIRAVQWKTRRPIASYILNPGNPNESNSFLYVCKYPYDRSVLTKKPRQSLNRAHKFVRIECVNWETLESKGFQAFQDTRTRAGLSDGTMTVFQKEIGIFKAIQGHRIFCAWKDDSIIGFLIGAQIDDYCELTLSCSTSDSLTWCPNNALFDSVFDYYLNERKCRLVSAGLSSIQEGAGSRGLHAFKESVGFEPIAVCRVFDLHPAMRPFINRFNYSVLKKFSIFMPENPILRKGIGAFDRLLGMTHPLNPAIREESS
jgi:hypothetical protein